MKRRWDILEICKQSSSGYGKTDMNTNEKITKNMGSKFTQIQNTRQRKEKQKCLFLCCLLTLFFYGNPQGDRQAKKNYLTSPG